MSIVFTDEMIKVDKIKDIMWKQVSNHPLGSPRYYAVLFYGNGFDGEKLKTDDYRKRWDLSEVKKTHKFIRKQIHKCFGENIPLWFHIERHKSTTDNFGNVKLGSFHTNLYIGDIDDDAIINPSPYLMPLFYKTDTDFGIPIHMRTGGVEEKKLLLLDACIRQAKWIGTNPNSCEVLDIPIDEMEATFMYSMKDINNGMDGFDTMIDWGNSDYYNGG